MPTAEVEQMVCKALPKLPSSGSALPLSSSNFVSQLAVPAQITSQQSGIPHHLIMAQAALESGWGQREIPTADGRPSHNLFGIKAGSNWDGPVTEITTTEYEDGVAKKVKASFRVYDSYMDALGDYVKLLTNNPRYSNVTAAGSAEQAAHALQRAGYATDPQYAQKLITMIQQIKNTSEKAVKAYTHDLSQLF
uniref:Mannosyl-glycoprotein endo-beta-N-acetylglucosamidase-like domain-containing protein n=1 Tax=Bracon brevicornis TaxID=1563983 RepID=A0A6V7KEH8_9HYME